MTGEEALREAEGRLRPAPGPYPIDVEGGDKLLPAAVGRHGGGALGPRDLSIAVDYAEARAALRGCRQRLAIKRGGYGAGRWVVQDVREGR